MIIEKVWRQIGNKWCIKRVCSNCNYEDLDNVGFIKPTPDLGKQTKCPKCKSFGKDDFQKALRARIEQLTGEKSRIDIEIDKLIRDLEPEKEKQS